MRFKNGVGLDIEDARPVRQVRAAVGGLAIEDGRAADSEVSIEDQARRTGDSSQRRRRRRRESRTTARRRTCRERLATWLHLARGSESRCRHSGPMLPCVLPSLARPAARGGRARRWWSVRELSTTERLAARAPAPVRGWAPMRVDRRCGPKGTADSRRSSPRSGRCRRPAAPKRGGLAFAPSAEELPDLPGGRRSAGRGGGPIVPWLCRPYRRKGGDGCDRMERRVRQPAAPTLEASRNPTSMSGPRSVPAS